MRRNGSRDGNENPFGFSGADIMFAQMMIPHHEQAVAMSTLAETHTTTQAPEITQMKGWLTESGASLDPGHEMGPGMGGMMTDPEGGRRKKHAAAGS